MAVMKDLNQHLHRRGNRWHYVRRVLSQYADFDPRGMIRKSLKTESLGDLAPLIYAEQYRKHRPGSLELDDGTVIGPKNQWVEK